MTQNEPNNPGVPPLTARERQVALLVASGRTRNQVAAKIRRSRSTVARIIDNPAVRAEIESIRGQAIESGLGMLCSAFRGAVKELRKLARNGGPSDNVRLGSCRCLIESVLKVREQVDLARRLERLEYADAARNPGGIHP